MVQVVLIAESMRLQAMMGTYGIQTQTPHEVEPVQVSSCRDLFSNIFERCRIFQESRLCIILHHIDEDDFLLIR